MYDIYKFILFLTLTLLKTKVPLHFPWIQCRPTTHGSWKSKYFLRPFLLLKFMTSSSMGSVKLRDGVSQDPREILEAIQLLVRSPGCEPPQHNRFVTAAIAANRVSYMGWGWVSECVLCTRNLVLTFLAF